MNKATDHLHIVSDANGEALIQETRVPVRAIVELSRVAVRPEDIPDHLPQICLAQIFDALSYYADHREQAPSIASKSMRSILQSVVNELLQLAASK